MTRWPGYYYCGDAGVRHPDLHQRAKIAASVQGQTLKDYLIGALTAAVERTEKDYYERLGRDYGQPSGDDTPTE